MGNPNDHSDQNDKWVVHNARINTESLNVSSYSNHWFQSRGLKVRMTGTTEYPMKIDPNLK